MKEKSGKQYNPRLRYGALRRGQFIAPFGVGSIMDLPDESIMPGCIDYWHVNAGVKIYDERLQKRLKVKYFKMVPSGQEFKEGIPFFRFPKWLFCPKCRSIRPVDEWQTRYKAVSKNGEEFKIPRCDVCRVKLVPSRFIVACPNGHIDDFPWIEWVHGTNSCDKPDLKISTGGSTSGLAGISVFCNTCKKSRNMTGAFGKEVHQKCSGMRPWTGKTIGEKCEAQPKTLQRGASNAYFPKVVTSIVIPPYSDNLVEQISQTDGFSLLASQTGGLGGDSFKETVIQMIAQQIKKGVNEVRGCVNRMLGEENDDEQTTEIDYRFDEYMAFQGYIKEGEIDSRSFRIEIKDNDEYDIPGVENVVLVHRLREVRALVAFSRIKPLDRNELDEDTDKGGEVAKPVPVREDRNIPWLPAMEVRGEGIFIRFNDQELDRWQSSKKVQERASILNSRYAEMAAERGREIRNIPPKFLFLHTFAHLLIRQLSFECGYGSASLRERIYCDELPEEPKMSGVLIYTASGDAEGTLGGLVRQGKPEFLSGIVRKAIQYAAWCSSDPLCIESRGQGLDSLNLAACHACSLLPETSCEEFNRLLDRGMLVGTPEHPQIGFLTGLLSD